MNKLTCRNTNTGTLSHICSSIFKLYLINLITNQYLTLLFSFSVSLTSRLSPHHSPCLSRLPLGPEAQGRAMLSAVDVDHLKQKNTNNFKKNSQFIQLSNSSFLKCVNIFFFEESVRNVFNASCFKLEPLMTLAHVGARGKNPPGRLETKSDRNR